jgi:hypothetical protein
MKKILFFFFLCLSLNAQSSGGFNCYDKKKTVIVEAILGRSAGEPLSNLKFTNNKVTIDIPIERLAQYKSNLAEFYLLVLNSDKTQVLFELVTKKKIDPDGRATEGSLMIKDIKNTNWVVNCDFE